ncbi:MAG: thermonuclease family protein [Nocardioides sp.]
MSRLRRLVGLPVLALVAAMFAVIGPVSSASAADMDCADFSTQKAAQTFFLNHGGPSSDPHRLDYDGDGIACESNPCPCYVQKVLPLVGSSTTGPKAVVQRARVVYVVDGDTVDVRLGSGAKRRVRLLGIDTPEVYGGVECGGPQASRSMKRMLPKGTRVKLTSDPSQDLKDRYGRLLRYVTKVSTGKDVNRRQVYKGLARVYVYAHHPFKRVDGYRKAQRQAKNHHAGIWGALC